MRVNVICRNWQADRVLPRFARYLADGLGWTLTPAPVEADIHYLMGYFESQVCPSWPRGPVVSLFTHREEQPAGHPKAVLFDAIARKVDLRVAMARQYTAFLEAFGPTIQPPLPVERDRFVIHARPPFGARRTVVGLSGFTYGNHRKGEDLIAQLLKDRTMRDSLDWRACGRGWPVPTRAYSWKDMPQFYAGLDVLVCASRVEGGPMPVLEALSCGVSVVIPAGVGMLDELPQTPGIYRYARGDVESLAASLSTAACLAGNQDRDALRATTERYSVEAWCRAHAEAFEKLVGGRR